MGDFMRNIRNNENGQIITLMGFMIVLSVLILASIVGNLSSVGTEVHDTQSKGLFSEFTNIHNKFGLSLQLNVNSTESKDISAGFNETKAFFYEAEILNGRYFNATLNDYKYNGQMLYGAVYYVDVTLHLDDGESYISKDEVYPIVIWF